MSHGHCGIVDKKNGGRVLNDPTLALLARAAVSHAEAGADIVAPSDMMDGRVAAIRQALDARGFEDTPILSYAAKFASAYYGPFREAAESAPQFGDRRAYQMDGGNAREALREVALDLQEGRGHGDGQAGAGLPRYSASGENRIRLSHRRLRREWRVRMIKAAAAKGWVDERALTWKPCSRCAARGLILSSPTPRPTRRIGCVRDRFKLSPSDLHSGLDNRISRSRGVII